MIGSHRETVVAGFHICTKSKFNQFFLADGGYVTSLIFFWFFLKQKKIWITFLFVDRVDTLEDRQKIFFQNCIKKSTKPEEKIAEFDKIKEEYKKVIEEG